MVFALCKQHLSENKQSYCNHFKDSMSYSFQSLKASFYFFIHSLLPGFFCSSGSTTIFALKDSLDQKMANSSSDIGLELSTSSMQTTWQERIGHWTGL